MKRTSPMSVWLATALAAATVGMGASAAVADPGPVRVVAESAAVAATTTAPADSVIEWVGSEPEEHLNSRWRWQTYYVSDTAWIWATPGGDHRRTYLRCGSNKLNRIDSLRWHSGAERIFVTRNCVWNGKDGYSYTIRWQKRVLAGVV